MSDVNNTQKELTPRLRQMLAAYGNIPRRDADFARRAHANFMAELDRMSFEPTRPGMTDRLSMTSLWFSGLRRLREYFVSPFVKRSLLFATTILLVLSAYLAGGTGITVYAASSALPGERLYPIKTTLEDLQANLTLDATKQARLYLEFARRRLTEMQALIAKGRFNGIHQAASEYEQDIFKALTAIERLSQADRTEAVALNTELANSLRIYRGILIQMLIFVPDDQQPVIQSAIDRSQFTTDGTDDDDGAAGSIPTPTNTSTPVVLIPEPTAVSSTPTALPTSSGSDDVVEQKDDDAANNGASDDSENGAGTDEGGDDDTEGDDDGGNDDGDDDGGDD